MTSVLFNMFNMAGVNCNIVCRVFKGKTVFIKILEPKYSMQEKKIQHAFVDKENPSLVFSGDREIPTRGSTVPLERWTRGLEFPGSTVHQ